MNSTRTKSSTLFRLGAIWGLVLLSSCGGGGEPEAKYSLRYIGQSTLEPLMKFSDTTVGGISGIDYDAQRDVYYLLSDDRSDINAARFYTAKISLTSSSVGVVQLQSAVFLKKADGAVFGNKSQDSINVPDPESIRFVPETQTLLWSSEGDKTLGVNPLVRETKLDGSFVREMPTLPMLRIQPGDAGPRNNLAFEGLALAPDRKSYWVSMENALGQDGARPTPKAAGGPLRLTQFDLKSGAALRQIAYIPDAIPRAPEPSTASADNGVSEILMLDENRMLVLERAFSTGSGNSLRVYQVDVRTATDTLLQTQLVSGAYTPANKKLLLNFDSLKLDVLDNTEGVTFGPRLPNGNRTLLFVSDDNFRGFIPTQITQFVAFEVIETR